MWLIRMCVERLGVCMYVVCVYEREGEYEREREWESWALRHSLIFSIQCCICEIENRAAIDRLNKSQLFFPVGGGEEEKERRSRSWYIFSASLKLRFQTEIQNEIYFHANILGLFLNRVWFDFLSQKRNFQSNFQTSDFSWSRKRTKTNENERNETKEGKYKKPNPITFNQHQKADWHFCHIHS